MGAAPASKLLPRNNQGPAVDLTPRPLLDLFETYSGSYTDLDRGLELDGSQLRAARDQLVAGLRQSGVESGMRVLLTVGNGPGFITSLVAVLSVGASPVLLHVSTPAAELHRLAATYDAPFALCEEWSDTEHPAISESSWRLPLASDSTLMLARLRRPAAESVTTGASEGRGAAETAGVRRSLPSVVGMPLHPTSGTTGIPKLAARHGLAAVAEASHYRDVMGIDADDVILCVVPMSHAYGFGTSAIMPLVSGARLISSRRFQPHAVLKTFRERTITTFPAVPAMLHLMLVAARGPIERLPRRVLSAGAPLAEQTARDFFERNGQTAWSLYGSTETGGIAVDVEAPADATAGSVGPSMPPVSVEILPLPDTSDWQPGVGRVRIKSPSMMAGYLTPQGIDASSMSDGWFQTGDLGFVDSKGRIHLVGRESEVVNVFGMKVIPSEVESVIRDFPGVTDVKVYAGEHRSGSQIVKAAIAASASLDVAELRKYCAARLVAYKRPEVIIPLESLPRTATGKIIREQLP